MLQMKESVLSFEEKTTEHWFTLVTFKLPASTKIF